MKLERTGTNDHLSSEALYQLIHALNGAYTVDEAGNHTLVGADFSNHDWLEFWMGDHASYQDLIRDLAYELVSANDWINR